jgi:hypothetical protein
MRLAELRVVPWRSRGGGETVNVPRRGLLRPAQAWGHLHGAVGASLLRAFVDGKGAAAKRQCVAGVVGGCAGIELIGAVAVWARPRGRVGSGSQS